MRYIAAIAAIYIGFTQGFTPESVALIVLVLWSVPLSYIRLKFRKLVYKTSDWKIAIKPVFVKEIKVLSGILPLATLSERKVRNSYRLYLFVFLGFYGVWKYVGGGVV